MTEEIIIDGVDVAECDYILSNLACVNKEIKMKKCIKLCANIPNCIIKNNLRLKQENEELKKYIERMDNPEIQVVDGKIALDNIKYKQALENVKEIIDFRFKTPYMTFGYNEYAKLIKDIEKVVNEVLK